MAGDALKKASSAATVARTNYAGTTPRTLAYPSAIEETAEQDAYVVPETSEVGEACWVPATSREEVAAVVDNIIVDQVLVAQRRAVPIGFQAVRDLAEARQSYLDGIEGARQAWEKAGDVNDDVARMVRDARMELRRAIRARYPVAGFGAKIFYDIPRYGGTARYEAVLVAKTEALITEGRAPDVIRGALAKTNVQANRLGALAKVSLPIAKAIGIGGTIATAIEIPYRAYQLDMAKTKEEQQRAFVNLTEAGATLAATLPLASACLVFGIGTGGAGFLACGVAPVAAGIFAGAAARWVLDNVAQ